MAEGTAKYKQYMAIRVTIEFIGEENKLILSQCMGPTVSLGGGILGWVPGA
jgi:hypothetical protein